jgi:nitrite reductase/ring-hydroxylating ferredoxin subunit
VEVNGVTVVVFRHGEKAIASDARCPHAGAPLAAADIEDYGGVQCITCPGHAFLFSTRDGKSVVPQGTYTLRVYPTQVRSGGEVFVGFDSLAPAAFSVPDF